MAANFLIQEFVNLKVVQNTSAIFVTVSLLRENFEGTRENKEHIIRALVHKMRKIGSRKITQSTWL